MYFSGVLNTLKARTPGAIAIWAFAGVNLLGVVVFAIILNDMTARERASAMIVEPEPEQVAVVAQPAPAPALPPVPVEMTAGDCVVALQGVSRDLVLFYPPSGVGAPDINLVQVHQFASALSHCPAAKIIVEGHADETTDEGADVAVSWQRAENVVRALAGLGIPTERMHPLGYGARFPLAEGDADPEDAAMNRRVEFRVLLDPNIEE